MTAPNPARDYDSFASGRFPVRERSFEAHDAARGRTFPCEVWYPASAADTCPLVLFSHHSFGNRRASSFLCTHLASHGYIVAALDHSEAIVPELAPQEGESAEQQSARAETVLASRVPDIQVFLDRVLSGGLEPRPDPSRIGIAGHSMGGWTALAALESDARFRAVVALAPAGASNPKPGIAPAKLTFAWHRDVPALYLVAENDTSLPLSGMVELFERTPSTKQMVILRRADHAHFMDNVEQVHEGFRTAKLTGPLAEIQREVRPIAELCSGEQAHLFARGLTLAHLDAFLRQRTEAQQFLAGDLEAELARRGVDVIVHKHGRRSL